MRASMILLSGLLFSSCSSLYCMQEKYMKEKERVIKGKIKFFYQKKKERKKAKKEDIYFLLSNRLLWKWEKEFLEDKLYELRKIDL